MTILQEHIVANVNIELERLAQKLLKKGLQPGSFMYGYYNIKGVFDACKEYGIGEPRWHWNSEVQLKGNLYSFIIYLMVKLGL